MIGELSEFAPYDDSCEPLAIEEQAADYNERVHREEEEEQQFKRRYSGEVPANEWYGIIMECRFIFLFSNSTYPSLNRARDERDYVFCLSLQFRCHLFIAVVLILCDSFIEEVRQLIILYRRIFLVFDEFFTLNCRCSCSNCSVSLVTKTQECICCKEIDRCEEVMEEAIGDRTVCITLHPGFESVCLNRHVLEVAALGLKTRAGKSYTTVRGQSNKSDDE